MTLLDIVNKLLKEGNVVRYRIRSDGGIIITAINGKHYSGGEGNKVARQMTGITLSEARRIQLKRIAPKKGQSPKSRKKNDLDKEIQKQLIKVQRKWKKNVYHSKGMITKATTRWNIENLGIERTKEKLDQSMRYAEGLAYDKVISSLEGYIREIMYKISDERQVQALQELIDALDTHFDIIRDEWIPDIYDKLYDINHGMDARDIVNTIFNAYPELKS